MNAPATVISIAAVAAALCLTSGCDDTESGPTAELPAEPSWRDGAAPTSPSIDTDDGPIAICCDELLPSGDATLACDGEGCVEPFFPLSCEDPDDCALYCDIDACGAVGTDGWPVSLSPCVIQEAAACVEHSIEDSDGKIVRALVTAACIAHAKLWCATGGKPYPDA